MIRLPGVCIVCRRPVVWNGKHWKRWPGTKDSAYHVCPEDRLECGAWMPRARERCARRPGHGFEHKSRYALENARAMRTGRAA